MQTINKNSLPTNYNLHNVLDNNTNKDFIKSSHQKTSIHLKVSIMGIFTLLLIILYFVIKNHNSVLSMQIEKSYLVSESISSLSSNQNICFSSSCIQSASHILESLNQSVSPCENFYEFACGGWMQKMNLSDDQSSITEFGKLRNELNQKLRKLISLKPKKAEPVYLQYMRIIWKQCLNTSAIEKEESKPLLDVLNYLSNWPLLDLDNWNKSSFDFIDTLIKIRNLGYSHNTLFTVYPGLDIKNNTNYLLNIDQCSFSLSNRKYYLNNRDNKVLNSYRSSIKEAILLLNATNKDIIDESIDQIVDFEKKLASFALPHELRRNYSNVYLKTTVEDLQKLTPNINWFKLLPSIINNEVKNSTIINLKEPEFIKNVDNLIKTTDKTIIANYLIWRVIFNSMPQLSNSWRLIYEKLNRVISGRKTSKKRNSSCMQKLFNSFSVPLSALYVKTYFDAKSKKVVEQMISNIKAEFLQILSTLDWMDEVTRLKAIEKAKQIHTYVGYSNEILNDDKVMQLYEGLRINENWSYFTNIQKLKKHWTDNDFKKLKTKNVKTDWKKFSEAATINAFYNSLENSVKLPSGILTSVFYNLKRPNYLNYGAIGYIIGHEIIHGFDDKGRQFDKNGNHNNWWKNDTDEKFKNMTKCLIDQYDNYSVPEINMTVNGVLTLGENIADNGGLKQAYLGYQRYVKQNGQEPSLPGLNFTQNQLFWISSANVWCSSFRPEAMKARIFTGVHSPPKFRVIGSIVNNLDFSKDFNCKLGTNMNPVKKCSIW